MFRELKTVIDILEQNIQKNYNINVDFLYGLFKKDIVPWFNTIVVLSDKGHKYVYEYEKTNLKQINTRHSIKKIIQPPGSVFIYNILDKTFESINLYKTCLQPLYLNKTKNKEVKDFYTQFTTVNKIRICDYLFLRLNDMRYVLNHILHKKDDTLTLLENLDDQFKDIYIKQNLNFKKVFLNIIIPKDEIYIKDVSMIDYEIQFRYLFSIDIELDQKIYEKVINYINVKDKLYFPNNNDLCILHKIRQSKTLDLLTELNQEHISLLNMIKDLGSHFSEINYDIFINNDTVNNKKGIKIRLDIPTTRDIFTDILTYISIPDLKYI